MNNPDDSIAPSAAKEPTPAGSMQRVVSTPIYIQIGAFRMWWDDAPEAAVDEMRAFMIPWICRHHEIKDGKVC